MASSTTESGISRLCTDWRTSRLFDPCSSFLYCYIVTYTYPIYEPEINFNHFLLILTFTLSPTIINMQNIDFGDKRYSSGPQGPVWTIEETQDPSMGRLYVYLPTWKPLKNQPNERKSTPPILPQLLQLSKFFESSGWRPSSDRSISVRAQPKRPVWERWSVIPFGLWCDNA